MIHLLVLQDQEDISLGMPNPPKIIYIPLFLTYYSSRFAGLIGLEFAMGSTAKRIHKKYTISDYLIWPDEECREKFGKEPPGKEPEISSNSASV